MRRFIPLALLSFMLFSSREAEAQEVIKRGEVLNLERCISIALARHPNISAAINTAIASKMKIGEARANYYPQISGSGGYSRISPNDRSSSLGGAYDQYSSTLALSQNIYDFGRTSSQVRIADLNYTSFLSDLENVRAVTILNLKEAYFGLLQAKRNRDVASTMVKQSELHLEQARGLYEVGTRPRFDVTKAEVDLSNARLNLIRRENALRIAFVILNNAMGVPDAPEYSIEDNLSFERYDITLEDALARAFENRPDLRSISLKRQAAEASIDLAESNYYPFITGNASYNWAGEGINSIDNGWNIGVSITLPIFSGFLTRNQVEEAKANLNLLRANEESLRQAVVLEVQQAFLNLKEAEERIPTAELSVKQAEENLEIANGRYAAGVGNPIEVTDAEVALTNAKTALIQALYDYKVAGARLEKAMWVR